MWLRSMWIYFCSVMYLWYESRKTTLSVGKIPLSQHIKYCQHCTYQRLIPVIPPLLSCLFVGLPSKQEQLPNTTFYHCTVLVTPFSSELLESERTPRQRRQLMTTKLMLRPIGVKSFSLNVSRTVSFPLSNSSSSNEVTRQSSWDKNMLQYEGLWRDLEVSILMKDSFNIFCTRLHVAD